MTDIKSATPVFLAHNTRRIAPHQLYEALNRLGDAVGAVDGCLAHYMKDGDEKWVMDAWALLHGTEAPSPSDESG